MRQTLVLALALTLFSVTTLISAQEFPASRQNLGSVTGGDVRQAEVVIEKKCTSCHNAERIREAFAAGKDMHAIQRRMEQKGVRLSADERYVLGIFWKHTPLKEKR